MNELETATRIAAQARNGEQIEAFVTRSRDTEIRVFGGEVESLSVAEVAGVGVRVIAGHRQGFAFAGSIDADVVDETLAEARDNASFGAADDAFGLAGPDDAASAAPAELDLWREDLACVPADRKVALVLELESATKSADARIRGVESADYGDSAIEVAVASSTGVQASWRRTMCSIYSSALAGAADETQTGYGFSVGRTIGDLDVEQAARDAAERATRLLGARQPASARLPVVLDPMVTRSVLSLVGAALSGEALLKGRSMFVDRAGEQVAADAVTIVDDPTIAESLGASPRDSEGVPTRRTELVSSGTLVGFLHNVYTARRSGVRTTGSAVRGFKATPGVGARALHLVPGSATPDELVDRCPEALYVQSVSGLHSGTNIVSGDFSVGAEGLMIRDGAFAEPVREITIASTLQRMLLDVAAVGNDLTWLPGGAAGATVLIGDMTMSGS
ncbi:MAG TPA: TldD/PmbA family protein [Acidimicrobiia bacterium]|jgi:PmbA protein